MAYEILDAICGVAHPHLVVVPVKLVGSARFIEALDTDDFSGTYRYTYRPGVGYRFRFSDESAAVLFKLMFG